MTTVVVTDLDRVAVLVVEPHAVERVVVHVIRVDVGDAAERFVVDRPAVLVLEGARGQVGDRQRNDEHPGAVHGEPAPAGQAGSGPAEAHGHDHADPDDQQPDQRVLQVHAHRQQPREVLVAGRHEDQQADQVAAQHPPAGPQQVQQVGGALVAEQPAARPVRAVRVRPQVAHEFGGRLTCRPRGGRESGGGAQFGRVALGRSEPLLKVGAALGEHLREVCGLVLEQLLAGLGG